MLLTVDKNHLSLTRPIFSQGPLKSAFTMTRVRVGVHVHKGYDEPVSVKLISGVFTVTCTKSINS